MLAALRRQGMSRWRNGRRVRSLALERIRLMATSNTAPRDAGKKLAEFLKGQA
jgi:hypothetical protein